MQLAVWEATEDGGEQADFNSGRFSASASPAVISFAQHYYDNADPNGDALFLEASSKAGGQGQVTIT